MSEAHQHTIQSISTKGQTVHRSDKLWKQSQITQNFISPQVSFSKEKRFKLHSIYWPQEEIDQIAIRNKCKSDVQEAAWKISKLIDEEEKNQMRMAKMSLKKSFNCKANKGVLREKSNSLNVKKTIAKLDLHNEEIVQRLVAHSVKLQSRMRDRHGNRSNLLQDEEHTLLSKLNRDVKRMCATTGFKTSQKIKLELPLNYYPGPGAYEIIDISQTTKNKSKKCIESERGFVSKER